MWSILLAEMEDTRIIRWRKGTWPQEMYMEPWYPIFEDALVTASHWNIVNKPQTESHHSARFWKSTLEVLTSGGYRFLQCDKNQGIHLISEEEYTEIARIEADRYVAVPHSVETENQIIKLQIKMMEALAATISKAFTKMEQRTPKHRIKHNTKHLEALREISQLVHSSIDKPATEFHLPEVRLLLKVHKKRKQGQPCPTRPIIPNCGLPSYRFSKWIGSLLAKVARKVLWNLESTDQFIKWLTDDSRGPNVRTFDFTNLYGSEPVNQTMKLFANAIEDLVDNENFALDDAVDNIVWKALTIPTDVPDELKETKEILGDFARLIVIITTELVRETMAKIDVGKGITKIVGTDSFLAMGCAPVAPVSILTLAHLETHHIGAEKCAKGMRRLIDDIVVDTDIITEEELRKAYPNYLELNAADEDHFLDVRINWSGRRWCTYPYIKPFATVPLNVNSCHPWTTLRAAAKNELLRMWKLCSHKGMRPQWTQFWYSRYKLADYNEEILRSILKEAISGVKTEKVSKERGINHVETWRGSRSPTDSVLTEKCNVKFSTAWKCGTTLMSMALKAHKQQYNNSKL